MIEIKEIKFNEYSSFVLNIQNLCLSDMGLFLIVGENGSGKSTFLEALSGLIRADSCILSINGRDLTEKELIRFQEEGISFVHQSSLVFDNLTCLENILLPFAHPDKKKALACLKEVGLMDFANQKAKDLSSGERQRLSFSRVLYEEKPIVLLDEVTSNLDKVSSEILENCIHELSTHALVLFATHENSNLKNNATILHRKKGSIEGKQNFKGGKFEHGKALETKKYKFGHQIQRGFRRNLAYYLTLGIVAFLLFFIGGILNAFQDSLGYAGVNPNRKNVQEKIYLENASAFFYYGKEQLELKETEFFYGQHYSITSIQPDIGESLYDFAYIPSTSSFEKYNISLAMTDQGSPLGRYPVSSSEARISDYCFQVYSKKNPSLNSSEIFNSITGKLRQNTRRSDTDKVTIVGVYKGLEWTKEDAVAKKRIENGYPLDTDAGTFYYFLQDTVVGIADSNKENNNEYAYFLLNTERNRKFRKGHRNQVHIYNYQTQFDDYGSLILPVTEDGYPAYKKTEWLANAAMFGKPIFFAGFILPFVFLIAFFFHNKKKYLLLRSMGYKRNSLLKEDCILHGIVLLLSSLLSFGVSELVLWIANYSFSLSISGIHSGINCFAHSYTLPLISVAYVFAFVIVFFFFAYFLLLKKNRTKQANELKIK